MKVQMKQRLIGALVLIALVAIFLPLLFHSTRPSMNLNVSTQSPTPPAKPELQLSEQIAAIHEADEEALTTSLNGDHEAVPSSQPAKASAQETPVVTQEILKVNPASQDADSAVVATQKAPAVASTSTVPNQSMSASFAKGQVESSAKSVSASSALPSKAVTKTRATLAHVKPPAIKSGWVLQVGTFSQKDNAYRLVKQLQKEGLAAYTKAGKVGSRQVTRVYVGPVKEKEKMQALQRQVKVKLNLSSIIKKYET